MTLTLHNYEYMNEDSINDELQCAICTQPYHSPVSLHCNHIFCQSCITTWIHQNSSCPICRQQYGSECTLTEVTEKTLCAQLDTLLVRCRRCGKDGFQRSKFQAHLKRCSRKRLSAVGKFFCYSWRSVIARVRTPLNRQATTIRPTPVNRTIEMTVPMWQPDIGRLDRVLPARGSTRPQAPMRPRAAVTLRQDFLQNLYTNLTSRWQLIVIFFVYVGILMLRLFIMLAEVTIAVLNSYWKVLIITGIIWCLLKRRRGN